MFDKLPMVDPSPVLLALDIALFLLFASIAAIWVSYIATRTDNKVAIIAHGIFAAYLVLLACVVFLPLHGIRAAAESYDGTSPLSRAWYWGFQVHSPIVDGRMQWQRVGNIVMTMPFGFGFGLLAPRLGVRRIFAACMAWAVSLELIQLGISVLLGFVYRTFDINDIIDNAFGAWFGLAFFVTCALLVRSSGFGAGAPVTTVPGFVADSVDRYFAGYEERRSPGPPDDGVADQSDRIDEPS